MATNPTTGFLYLKLFLEHGNQVVARFAKDGRTVSTGGESTRMTDQPFIAVAIDHVEGLDVISERTLLELLRVRLSEDDLVTQILHRVSTERLAQIVATRAKAATW